MIYQKDFTVLDAEYGFDQISLSLMLTMFTAVTVNRAYSSYAVINNGVPEGFLLGPFLKKLILQINFCGTITLQTTRRFPLKISTVNVIKFAVS